MKKELIFVAVFMLIIWSSLLVFWYLKADEITKNPCLICAEKHGEKVLCTLTGAYPITRTYETNGTIYDNSEEVLREAYGDYEASQNYTEINFSLVNPRFTN